MRRLPLESIRDLRSFARSIGTVPLNGLLKGLKIPVGGTGTQCFELCDRLAGMTGITHLKLHPTTPNARFPTSYAKFQFCRLFLLRKIDKPMQLLVSLEIVCMDLISVARAAS